MAKPIVRPFSYKIEQDWPENLMTDDLRLVFEAFDIEVGLLFQSVQDFTKIISADEVYTEFLDVFLMSRGFKVFKDFPTISLTENQKRKLARLATRLQQQKGTARGIVNAVRLLLGIESAVVTQYNVEVWKLGESELGVDTILFPTGVDGQMALYSFDIVSEDPISEQDEINIRALAKYMKPAHTHLIQVIQPAPPIDHWVLGVSDLGETTDLHEAA